MPVDMSRRDLAEGLFATVAASLLPARATTNGKGVAPWQPVGNRPEVMDVGDDFKQVPVARSQTKVDFWESFLLATAE